VSTYEDIQPPRLGRSMLHALRAGRDHHRAGHRRLGGDRVLLEVKTVADIIKSESTPLAAGVKDLLADVRPGKAQTILMIGDDRRKNEVWADGKALKHRRRPLGHDDPRAAGPAKEATALMSLPRDLIVDIPGAAATA
jgi:hypothetical protein